MWEGREAFRILYNRDGSTLVEFSLVAWLFFLIVMGTVEFSYFMYQYSVASKAAQMAIRYASVSNPAVYQSDFDVLKSSSGNIRCAMNGNCVGGTACENVMQKIVNVVQSVAPFVQAENIILEYKTADTAILGEFVPSITVSFENVQFSTIFFGYMAGASLPSLNYTALGEDLNSLPPAAAISECGA